MPSLDFEVFSVGVFLFFVGAPFPHEDTALGPASSAPPLFFGGFPLPPLRPLMLGVVQRLQIALLFLFPRGILSSPWAFMYNLAAAIALELSLDFRIPVVPLPG